MKTFKDNSGRNWTLAIDVNALKRCRKLVDVDLLAIDQGEPQILAIRLELDAVLLCDVLWALLKPDAEGMSPPVTDEDFGRGMGGTPLKQAREALNEELTDFFLQLGRQDLANVLTTQKAYMKLALDRKSKQLAGLDLAALLLKSQKERPQPLPAPEADGSKLTSVPELLESTLDPLPSAN